MVKTKILKITFALSFMIGLSSCGNNNGLDWNFTKEESGNATEMSFSSSLVDGVKRYTVAHYEPIVDSALTKNDVIFFDLGKALTEFTDETKEYDYLTYDIVKQYKIEYTDVITDEDLSGFTLTAPKGSSNKVGILVHKSKTVDNDYLVAIPASVLTAKQKTAQEEFEAAYSKSKKAKIITSVLQAVVSIGQSVAGLVIGEQAGTVICGLVGLLNNIIGTHASIGEPSIRDVLAQLYRVEGRINELKNIITTNFADLKKQAKLTQNYVSQVSLQQYASDTTEFESKYFEGLNVYNSRITNTVLEKMQKLSEKPLEINVPLYKNESGQYTYRTLTEVEANKATDLVVTVNVEEFVETKKTLIETNNIFVSSAVHSFEGDIYNSTKGITLPEGISRETLTNFALTRVVQEITKVYYSSHADDAQTYMSLVTSMANRINGVIGDTILESYENRLRYLYNFASEMKPAYNTVMTRLSNVLDTNFACALEASFWAKKNYEQMSQSHYTASNAIAGSVERVEAIKDNYSFILQQEISADLYSSHTNSHFTVKGNNPTHYHHFAIYKYDGTTIDVKTEIDQDKFSSIDSGDHYALALRMNNLKHVGYVDSDTTYRDYLIISGVLSGKTNKVIEDGLIKKVIKNDYNKFVTTIEHRNVQDHETDIACYFTDACTGKAKYFTVGQWYNYRSYKKAEYWHATCWSTTYVNALTGEEISGEKIVGLKGCYDEGHWNWSNQEKYRFNDGPNQRFFYAITYVS